MTMISVVRKVVEPGPPNYHTHVWQAENQFPDEYPVLEHPAAWIFREPLLDYEGPQLRLALEFICTRIKNGEFILDDYIQAYAALAYVVGNKRSKCAMMTLTGENICIEYPNKHTFPLDRIDIFRIHKFPDRECSLFKLITDQEQFGMIAFHLELESRQLYASGMLTKRIFTNEKRPFLPPEVQGKIRSFLLPYDDQKNENLRNPGAQILQVVETYRMRAHSLLQRISTSKCGHEEYEFRYAVRYFFFLAKYLQDCFESPFAHFVPSTDIFLHSYEDFLSRAIKQNMFPVFDLLSMDGDCTEVKSILQKRPDMFLSVVQEIGNADDGLGQVHQCELFAQPQFNMTAADGRREMAIRILIIFMHAFFPVDLVEHEKIKYLLPEVLGMLKNQDSGCYSRVLDFKSYYGHRRWLVDYPEQEQISGSEHFINSDFISTDLDYYQEGPTSFGFVNLSRPIDHIISCCHSAQLPKILVPQFLKYVGDYPRLLHEAIVSEDAAKVSLIVLCRRHVPVEVREQVTLRFHSRETQEADDYMLPITQGTNDHTLPVTQVSERRGIQLKEVLPKALNVLVKADGYQEAMKSIVMNDAFLDQDDTEASDTTNSNV